MYVFSDRHSIMSSVSAIRLNRKILILLMLIFNFTWVSNVTWATEKNTQNPFENGWTLDTSSSSLTFQTISNDSTLENNSFETFDGSVDESGAATLRIQLDSVDTKIDLRNVRLRFLLFETYKYAEAVVSAKIDPAALLTLTEKSKIAVPLEFELDFHGVKQSFQIQTNVMKLIGNQISVSSAAPVSIETTLFGLDAGMKKLEESSKLSIFPMAAVSFNMIFNTSLGSTLSNETKDAEAKVTNSAEAKDAEAKASDSAEVLAKSDTVVPVAALLEIPKKALPTEEPDWAQEPATYTSPYSEPGSTAAETSGDLSNKLAAEPLTDEQCAKRFEDFSQSGGIYFKTASTKLDPKSISILTAIVDVANRCSQFKLTVAGHTDSIGGRHHNQKLSELRALTVAEYLINNNVDRERLSAVGFGETKPLVPNNTQRNRERNRRIEFTVNN